MSAARSRLSTSEMQSSVQIPAAIAGRRVWLRLGTMIDGSGAAPQRDAHVVYSKAGILYAGADTPPAEMVKSGRTATTPDAELPDYTLLPGLIDAHTHIFLEQLHGRSARELSNRRCMRGSARQGRGRSHQAHSHRHYQLQAGSSHNRAADDNRRDRRDCRRRQKPQPANHRAWLG